MLNNVEKVSLLGHCNHQNVQTASHGEIRAQRANAAKAYVQFSVHSLFTPVTPPTAACLLSETNDAALMQENGVEGAQP